MTKLGKDQLAKSTVPDDEGRVEKNVLTVKLLETAMSIIIYDTPFALSILNANEAASKLLFNELFMNLPNMDNLDTEKIVVMCFSNLMANFPVTNLPKILQDNLQPMLQQMVREIALIKVGEEEGDEYEDDDEEMEDVRVYITVY